MSRRRYLYLDGTPEAAYRPDAVTGHARTGSRGANVAATATRRRRPASGSEQARRVAWGKKWGATLRDHAQTYKRQED